MHPFLLIFWLLMHHLLSMSPSEYWMLAVSYKWDFIFNQGHQVTGTNTPGHCRQHRSTHTLIPRVSNKPAGDIMGGAGYLTHWMNLPKTEAEQNSCATRDSMCKYKVPLLESIRPFQTFSDSSLPILAAHRKPGGELCGAFVKLSDLYSLFAAYLRTSTQAGLAARMKERKTLVLCWSMYGNKTHAAVRAGPDNLSYVFFPSTQCWFLHCWSHFEMQKLTQKCMLMTLPGHAEAGKRIVFSAALFGVDSLWWLVYDMLEKCTFVLKTAAMRLTRERCFRTSVFSGRVSGWKTTAPSDLTLLNILFIPQW